MNEYKKKPAAQTVQQNIESSAAPEMTNGIPNSVLNDVFAGKRRATNEMMGHKENLAPSIAAKMSRAFGMDLTGMQLYRSDKMSGTGMKGISQGNKVVLSSDIDLNTGEGQAVLGHELSHIHAQSQGIGMGNSGLYNNAALEQQADREGLMAAHGRPIYESGMTENPGLSYGLGMRGVEGLTPVSANGIGASAGAPMQAKKDAPISLGTGVEDRNEFDNQGNTLLDLLEAPAQNQPVKLVEQDKGFEDLLDQNDIDNINNDVQEEVKAEPKPEVKAEPEPKPEVKAKPEPKPEVKAKPKQEDKQLINQRVNQPDIEDPELKELTVNEPSVKTQNELNAESLEQYAETEETEANDAFQKIPTSRDENGRPLVNDPTEEPTEKTQIIEIYDEYRGMVEKFEDYANIPVMKKLCNKMVKLYEDQGGLLNQGQMKAYEDRMLEIAMKKHNETDIERYDAYRNRGINNQKNVTMQRHTFNEQKINLAKNNNLSQDEIDNVMKKTYGFAEDSQNFNSTVDFQNKINQVKKQSNEITNNASNFEKSFRNSKDYENLVIKGEYDDFIKSQEIGYRQTSTEMTGQLIEDLQKQKKDLTKDIEAKKKQSQIEDKTQEKEDTKQKEEQDVQQKKHDKEVRSSLKKALKNKKFDTEMSELVSNRSAVIGTVSSEVEHGVENMDVKRFLNGGNVDNTENTTEADNVKDENIIKSDILLQKLNESDIEDLYKEEYERQQIKNGAGVNLEPVKGGNANMREVSENELDEIEKDFHLETYDYDDDAKSVVSARTTKARTFNDALINSKKAPEITEDEKTLKKSKVEAAERDMRLFEQDQQVRVSFMDAIVRRMKKIRQIQGGKLTDKQLEDFQRALLNVKLKEFGEYGDNANNGSQRNTLSYSYFLGENQMATLRGKLENQKNSELLKKTGRRRGTSNEDVQRLENNIRGFFMSNQVKEDQKFMNLESEASRNRVRGTNEAFNKSNLDYVQMHLDTAKERMQKEQEKENKYKKDMEEEWPKYKITKNFIRDYEEDTTPDKKKLKSIAGWEKKKMDKKEIDNIYEKARKWIKDTETKYPDFKYREDT